jgi:hypothetical protein
MAKPTYERVLTFVRRAVKDEFEKPSQGGYYDNQSVLVAVANEFQDLDTNNDEDEQMIRDAVREAEHEFNDANNVEL